MDQATEKSAHKLKSDIHKFRRIYPEITFPDIEVGNHTKFGDYEKFTEMLETGENYRFIITATVLVILILIVIFSWASTCFKSSTLFILSIIFAFFGLLALHFALGAQIAISVALSDLCINPAVFIERSILTENWMNKNETDIFLNCKRDSEKISRYNQLYNDLHDKRVRIYISCDIPCSD